MKIDRRCFLSLAGGLVAGHLLSPVPWKVTDDISIWTQNWPWTPVPETGPVAWKDTVCTMCPGGCGIKVRMIKDRVIKIEGREDYPVNRGSLCPLGYASIQYLYGPSRVTSPMKRTGERGSGTFEPISWDEAISEVSGKLDALRKNGQSHTVACISGSDKGTVPLLFKRFLEAYGSPNFIRTPSGRDAHEAAAFLAQGHPDKNVGFDLENATFILSFGCGLLDGGGAPGYQFSTYSRFERAHTLVQVEPRLSNTAAKAKKWLPAKPGTEGALALGLANVIIQNGLYNRNFIENYSFGFEDWTDDNGAMHMGFKRMVSEYTPAKVAGITGLEARQIESLAKDFARAQKPVAVCGYNECRAAADIDKTLAVHALNALLGNINQPGGMILFPDPEYAVSPVEKDGIASTGMAKPRADLAGTEKYPQSRYLLNLLPDILMSAKESDLPVQALLVTGANPVYTMEDSTTAQAAFAKIPFIVSFSSFMDETAQYADIILPDHHFLEGYRDVPAPDGVGKSITGLSTPVVSPRYDTRNTGDTIIDIAKKMGGSIGNAFPWDGYEAFLKEALKDRYRGLSRNGYVENVEKPAALDVAFATDSGKYEFYPTRRHSTDNGDEAKLPGFRETDIPGKETSDGVILIAYKSPRIASGAVANPPFMTKTIDADMLKKEKLFIQINPETAGKLNLKQGDEVVIETPAGKASVKVDLFEGIMPGLAAMPAGLGHTAYSRYIAGKGVNVNALLQPVADPAYGINKAWGIRAQLKKA